MYADTLRTWTTRVVLALAIATTAGLMTYANEAFAAAAPSEPRVVATALFDELTVSTQPTLIGQAPDPEPHARLEEKDPSALVSLFFQLVKEGRWPQLVGLLIVSGVLLARAFGLSRRVKPKHQTIAATLLAGAIVVGGSLYDGAVWSAVLVNVFQGIVFPLLTFLAKSDKEEEAKVASERAPDTVDLRDPEPDPEPTLDAA